MLVNIALGCVIAVVLLVELVYLPYKHEIDARPQKSVQVEMSKGGDGTVRRDDIAAVSGHDRPGATSAPATIKGPSDEASGPQGRTTDAGVDLQQEAMAPTSAGTRRENGEPASSASGARTASLDALGFAAPVTTALQIQVNDDRVKLGTLARELADARERLAAASRAGVEGGSRRAAIEAVRAEDGAKLTDERKRASEVADRAGAADREALAREARLRGELDGARAHGAEIDRDLATARGRLAQTTRDAAGAEQAARVAQAAQADLAARLDGQHRSATELSDRLMAIETAAATRENTLQQNLVDAQARSVGLERDLATAGQRSNQAGTDKAVAATAKVAALSSQLDVERSRSAAVQRDLAAARSASAQADADKARSARDRASAEADLKTGLEAERKRADDLSVRAVAADRNAAQKQDQLDGELIRSAHLAHDLQAEKDRSAHGRADAERSIHIAQAAQAGAEAKLNGERRSAVDLSNRLTAVEEAAVAREDSLKQHLADAQAQTARLERDLGSAVQRSEQTGEGAKEAMAAKLVELNQQMDVERARSASLTGDLAAAHLGSDQAGADAALRARDRASAETTLKSDLKAERERADVLSDRLATADRDAALVRDLQRQLDAERIRSAGLDRGLAIATQQIARRGREEQGGSVQTEAGDAEHPSGQVEKNPAADGESQPGAAGVKLDRPGPASDPNPAPAAVASLSTAVEEPAGPAAQNTSRNSATTLEGVLPVAAPARVVLHYRRGSQPARLRATTLKAVLQSRGLAVGDLIGTAYGDRSHGVTFFYTEDQGSADRVAGILNAAQPVKVRLPRNGTVLPGTIEVAVDG